MAWPILSANLAYFAAGCFKFFGIEWHDGRRDRTAQGVDKHSYAYLSHDAMATRTWFQDKDALRFVWKKTSESRAYLSIAYVYIQEGDLLSHTSIPENIIHTKHNFSRPSLGQDHTSYLYNIHDSLTVAQNFRETQTNPSEICFPL